jgi:ribulose-phosphate 3-epimerase
MNNYQLSASIICADFLNLHEELIKVNNSMIDSIHCDIMDGVFVPRFGLRPEIIKAIRSTVNIPIDIHLMVVDPEPYIEIFSQSLHPMNNKDTISIHIENNVNIHRTVQKIKQHTNVGIVINPATSLSSLDYLLDDINMITIMGINPGIVGHPLIPQTVNKIKQTRDKIGHRDILIQVDGGVTFDSSPSLLESGADILVCGSATIFKEDRLEENIRNLRNLLSKEP